MNNKEKQWKTVKGWWLSANKFEDVYGNIIDVAPYKVDLDIYRDQFPIACYMQLLDKTVKNIVLRDDPYSFSSEEK